MKYLFDTENHNSPELLEQHDIDKDLTFFDELENQIRTARELYHEEMFEE